tara:strand:+ start:462 stop:743 length:282 start_codon:yes stop_codon:yes gene_type:complete
LAKVILVQRPIKQVVVEMVALAVKMASLVKTVALTMATVFVTVAFMVVVQVDQVITALLAKACSVVPVVVSVLFGEITAHSQQLAVEICNVDE